MTSYLRATVELRDSDGRIFTEEGESMATFTGLTSAMEHYVSVTFIFAGNFLGPATRLARTTRTLDDGESHDRSHDPCVCVLIWPWLYAQ